MRTPDLNDARDWQSFASGGAQCTVTDDNGALRIEYDFRGESGFVGIRRVYERRLPDPFSVAFRIRGMAPPNALEFKLADPSNENAWRWRAEAFEAAPEPQQITLRESQIEFAWGPAGGGRLRTAGAMELVVAAGPGGQGTLWIEDLQVINRSPRKAPVATASSHTRDRPASDVLSRSLDTGWKPAKNDAKPWLLLDFQEPREYGGLIIDWGPSRAQRRFTLESSNDGKAWSRLYRASGSSGSRSFIPLPNGESQFLRLVFQGAADVRRIEAQAFDFAKTRDDLFSSIARLSPRGSFPRYLLMQQSYWTCAGVPDGVTSALINEEGLVEPDRGTFSIEPFLEVDGALLTWADARRKVRLEPGGIPIPTVTWSTDSLQLETTPFATGRGQDSTLFIRYRVRNRSRQPLRVKLIAALRPHQVSPPWQRWKTIGGVSEIRDIAWKHNAAWVNGERAIIPLSKPSAFGAMAFDEGLLTEALAAGRPPRHDHVRDEHGLASAALSFNLNLKPGGTREVYLAVPFGVRAGMTPSAIKRIADLKGAAQFDDAVRRLSEEVSGVQFQTPTGLATAAVETFHTAAGQVLINRDGPALQPGPRRYTRSWIRDGALMGSALARAGNTSPLADFVRWYAPFQRADGFVPCCVDRDGPDWLVEHDSHGQLIAAAMEAFRFSRDRSGLEQLWPSLRRAATFLETLCEPGPSKDSPQPDSPTRGLLPESASHEGYLAQPVHSYWDDFWGIRGLRDASAAASELGFPEDARRFARSAAALADATLASIREVIRTKKLHYIPGSVEWADFDPTATSNALMLFADTAGLPERPLRAMFQQFINDSRKRHRGEAPWKNYTAYEIRIVGALIRLGWRKEAYEFLSFYLSDQRPRAWNQWPEISWRDPRSPGHLGDVPHTWIGAEYMLVFASLFAYERESDSSLVLAAGIPLDWITRRKLSVQGLPTWFGPLDLSLKRLADNRLEITIGGALELPPGGIVLRPPCPAPIQSVELNGHELKQFTSEQISLDQVSAILRIQFGKEPAG